MRILAVDPGGTTGIARYDSAEKQETFGSVELPTMEALLTIDAVLSDSLRKPDLVVCELFVIGSRTAKKTLRGSYDALESIGAIKYLAHIHGVEFVGHAPFERNFATNARLKKLGWRHPTPGGHCDDAARHLLVEACRRGIIDPATFKEEE